MLAGNTQQIHCQHGTISPSPAIIDVQLLCRLGQYPFDNDSSIIAKPRVPQAAVMMFEFTTKTLHTAGPSSDPVHLRPSPISSEWPEHDRFTRPRLSPPDRRPPPGQNGDAGIQSGQIFNFQFTNLFVPSIYLKSFYLLHHMRVLKNEDFRSKSRHKKILPQA